MKLSGADIKGALPSMPAIVAIFAAVNGIFYLLSFVSTGIYTRFCGTVNAAGVHLFALLLLSLCLTAIAILFVLLISGIKGIFRMIFNR